MLIFMSKLLNLPWHHDTAFFSDFNKVFKTYYPKKNLGKHPQNTILVAALIISLSLGAESCRSDGFWRRTGSAWDGQCMADFANHCRDTYTDVWKRLFRRDIVPPTNELYVTNGCITMIWCQVVLERWIVFDHHESLF